MEGDIGAHVLPLTSWVLTFKLLPLQGTSSGPLPLSMVLATIQPSFSGTATAGPPVAGPMPSSQPVCVVWMFMASGGHPAGAAPGEGGWQSPGLLYWASRYHRPVLPPCSPGAYLSLFCPAPRSFSVWGLHSAGWKLGL